MVSESSLETFTSIRTHKFLAPITPTSESMSSFKPTTFVCYQVKSVSHNFFNLFSSSCLSINAQFILRAEQFYISSIGMVIVGSNGQCTEVAVFGNAHDCQITVNRKLIPSSYSSHSTGSPVIEIDPVSPRVTMVTVSPRLDGSTRVLAKIKCTWNPHLKTSVLDLYIPTSLRLPKSRGLLGQLWNVPATVISPECEEISPSSQAYPCTRSCFLTGALSLSSITQDNGTEMDHVCMLASKVQVSLRVHLQTTLSATCWLLSTSTPSSPPDVCRWDNINVI